MENTQKSKYSKTLTEESSNWVTVHCTILLVIFMFEDFHKKMLG